MSTDARDARTTLYTPRAVLEARRRARARRGPDWFGALWAVAAGAGIAVLALLAAGAIRPPALPGGL